MLRILFVAVPTEQEGWELAGWDDPSPRLLLPLPYKDRTQTGRWQIPALSRVVRRLGRLAAGRGGVEKNVTTMPRGEEGSVSV